MPKRRKTCVPFHHRPVLTSGTLQLWDLHDELILNQIIIVRETAERDDKKSASTTTKQRLVCMGVGAVQAVVQQETTKCPRAWWRSFRNPMPGPSHVCDTGHCYPNQHPLEHSRCYTQAQQWYSVVLVARP